MRADSVFRYRWDCGMCFPAPEMERYLEPSGDVYQWRPSYAARFETQMVNGKPVDVQAAPPPALTRIDHIDPALVRREIAQIAVASRGPLRWIAHSWVFDYPGNSLTAVLPAAPGGALQIVLLRRETNGYVEMHGSVAGRILIGWLDGQIVRMDIGEHPVATPGTGATPATSDAGVPVGGAVSLAH